MGQEWPDEFLAQKLSDLKVAKEALAKKDSEITMLRKESEWMKRELRDRDEEIKALRLTKVSAKAAPKKEAGAGDTDSLADHQSTLSNSGWSKTTSLDRGCRKFIRQ